jgi:hypothetical protein
MATIKLDLDGIIRDSDGTMCVHFAPKLEEWLGYYPNFIV